MASTEIPQFEGQGSFGLFSGLQIVATGLNLITKYLPSTTGAEFILFSAIAGALPPRLIDAVTREARL